MASKRPRRSGLLINGGRGMRTTNGRGEPHPTLMRTLAAQPRRVERLCQGTCPGRSRYSCVPSIAAIQKATGSLLERKCPVRHGWRLGRSVRANLLGITRRGLAGVGRTWDGHRPSPFYLGQRHADSALVPRPTGGPRPDYATTAVEIDGRGRRPIKPSGYLGGPGPHLRSRCSPDCLGSS